MLVSNLKSQLAVRLEDSNMIYWTSSNLDLIIKEALLTFASVSNYWKRQILIETTDNASIKDKQVYDITKAADVKIGIVNTEVSFTYQDIVNWVDIDLLGHEDVIDDIDLANLISNAINEFQSNTKLILAEKQFPIILNQNTLVDDEVLDIVGCYYIDSSGNYKALERADENSVALYQNALNIDVGTPRFYSVNNLSLQRIDLIPKPTESGTLEIIYVIGKASGQNLASNCLIPNNLTPYLKYKIESDIFSLDSPIADKFRADYCAKRWQEGLAIGQQYSSITNVKINGQNKHPSSLKDFDRLRYNWRNDVEVAGKRINSVALAGYNLLAINRIPVDKYSVLLEVVSNAPINETTIDLRSDYVAALIDYCVHLAYIRDGIANIQKTINSLQNFLKIGINHHQSMLTRRLGLDNLLKKSRYNIIQSNLYNRSIEDNAA